MIRGRRKLRESGLRFFLVGRVLVFGVEVVWWWGVGGGRRRVVGS